MQLEIRYNCISGGYITNAKLANGLNSYLATGIGLTRKESVLDFFDKNPHTESSMLNNELYEYEDNLFVDDMGNLQEA